MADPIRYRRLDVGQIIETLARLRDRVAERFPESGLRRVSEELLVLASEASECVVYLQRPNWPIRIGVGFTIALMVSVLILAFTSVRLSPRVDGLSELVQTLESAINDLVFLGVGIFFLFTVEGRIKRRKALRSLHQLRSVVHIVDMHQLTKDPDRVLSAQVHDTAASPPRTMSVLELGRYLDYCSELLSLSSKIAALFVQDFNDPVVLGAVDEIETLSAGMSGKIWQKITLLERVTARSYNDR